jgi:uncharacterized protein
MNRKEVEERMILLGIVGSKAYGIDTPGSDTDLKGICIGKRENYFGVDVFEQKDGGWLEEEGTGRFGYINDCPDTCVYEVRKYIRLAAQANPNILEQLWLDDYLYQSEAGKYLVGRREEFLSTKVKHSYMGYSYSQLKRIERHRKWLLDPPDHPPTLEEFGLSDSFRPLSKTEINTFLEFLYLLVRDAIEFMEPAEDLYRLLIERIDYKQVLKQHSLPVPVREYVQSLTRSSSEFMTLLQSTHEYRTALNHWRAYQDWKIHRNKSRAAIETRCGFDGKMASQALRLLASGIEILREGVIHIDRRGRDADLLLSIRRGERSYAYVMDMADQYMDDMEQAYKTSSLPRSVDHKRINEICIQVINLQGFL